MSVSNHEEVLEAINFRESLIRRAKQMVIAARDQNLLHGKHGQGSKFIAHELTTLANDLRKHGLRCVMVCVLTYMFHNFILLSSSLIT